MKELRTSLNQLLNLAAIRLKGPLDNDELRRLKQFLFLSSGIAFRQTADRELKALFDAGATEIAEGRSWAEMEGEKYCSASFRITPAGETAMTEMFKFALDYTLDDFATCVDLFRIAGWFYPDKKIQVLENRRRRLLTQLVDPELPQDFLPPGRGAKGRTIGDMDEPSSIDGRGDVQEADAHLAQWTRSTLEAMAWAELFQIRQMLEGLTGIHDTSMYAQGQKAMTPGSKGDPKKGGSSPVSNELSKLEDKKEGD